MPAGQKIKMYYDPLGRVVRTVNPDASEQRVVFGVPLALDTPTSYSPTPWESYTYDAEDLDVSSDHYATPKSAVVDALGRSVKTIDRLVSNNLAADNPVMIYQYDIRGNLLSVKQQLTDGSPTTYSNIFDYVYDLRPPAKEGESIPPLKTVHIDKGTSTIVFDCMGKPLQGDDAKGARTLSAYDELMRPTDAWARDVAGEDITLRQHLVYGDSAGLTDPQDENLKGKLYEQYDEAGYQKITEYDFKGNLLNKFRQVIKDTELLSVFSGPPVDWEVTPYRVDWTSLPSIVDSKEYHTDMTYDALNRIMTLTYPEDTDSTRKVLTPAYNKAGALFSVNLDGTDYVKEIAYNAKGQRLLIALGNDWMTRYTYDPLTFRLQRLKTEKFVYTSAGGTVTYEPQSGTTRQDFAYTYDWVGNILSINNETPACGVGGSGSLLRDFDYDALYRLISGTGRENQPSTAFPGWDDTTRSDDANATESYIQNYSYDRMGNFDEFQHVASSSPNNFTRTFAYVSGKNLLDSITIGSNSYSFDYDSNGNLVTENTERHFEWDYADQMRSFFNQTGTSEPTVYTQYLYAGGARVKKITRKSSGDKYITVYIDGIFEHSYHLDGSNAMDEELNELHVMDDQTRVAMLRIGYDDGTPFTKYILSDHLGSSNVILETSGAVYNREEFYPFGETSFGAFGKKRYRYVGKEKDEESGMYYYGARYFQPWSCRFISVDPLAGKYAQLTPYNYAANDPIGDLDVDGMQTPSTDTSAKSDTTSTVQQAQSETKKPATSPLPEQGNDIFDEKGNYIRTESNNQKENNIYIINKAGEKKLLSNYAFDKKNASALASIAKYYSQFSDTKSSSLLNGNFSVAMRKETPIIGESGKPLGLPKTESVPLFNKGVTSTILGETSIMTSSWEGNGTKKITVSVDNSGYTNDKLNDKFNFINTLQHEGQHKQGDSQSEFNHLDIYLNQIKHPSWQLTTGDYKANAINNIKEIIFLAKTWQGSKGQSQSDIQAIHKGAIIYENKFKKRLPQY